MSGAHVKEPEPVPFQVGALVETPGVKVGGCWEAEHHTDPNAVWLPGIVTEVVNEYCVCVELLREVKHEGRCVWHRTIENVRARLPAPVVVRFPRGALVEAPCVRDGDLWIPTHRHHAPAVWVNGVVQRVDGCFRHVALCGPEQSFEWHVDHLRERQPAPLAEKTVRDHGVTLTFGVDKPAQFVKPVVTHDGCDPVGGHNARCVHCGAAAYVGLLESVCLREGGCGPEKEPEPVLSLEAYCTTTQRVAERVWKASGHGVAAFHPVRETAIAFWREKVRGKR